MANFGETLKRERELREISLRQISEATKINIRYLEALEENRFDALPGGLFNKGFIRAYAACIGVDGEAMVNSYLHELSGRQGGSDGGTARGPMHRPLDVPQRRALQPTERPSPQPAITAAQRRMHEPGSAGADALRAALAHAPADAAPGAPPARERQPHAIAPRPAVTGIEDADPHAPASSRVLVWVLSLVAVAGVLFLILSLARGTKPGTPSSPEGDRPAAHDAGEPGSPALEPRPENSGDPGQADTSSALLPEVASQSPLMLGSAGSPPSPRPAPPPVETPTPKPVVKRVAPEPIPAPVADTVENDPVRENRASRGPMKIEIEAVDRTFVVLVCDGREVLSRTMEAGDKERTKCDSVIRVSASDAGAVRLTMNGDPCLPLGEPGTRAYGYTIHLDDSVRICPPPGGGAHVGP